MNDTRQHGRIIITGASGFVGGRLARAMQTSARAVICTSRNPERARSIHPTCRWERLDAERPETIDGLLRPGDRVFYLIHGMSDGDDYSERESRGAHCFAQVARDREVARIVYLGGPEPQGTPSRHLSSRLLTGEILRNSGVPTVELRASMIIGSGSESWRIVRDLAARLPIMVLPRWLQNHTQPIAIRDVVAALLHALDLDDEQCGVYDLPGPEVMTFEEVLVRTAKLRGSQPRRIHVPVLTPRLSAFWLRFVTGADIHVVNELVEGLRSDLVAEGDGYWRLMPNYQRTSFDEAAREALRHDEQNLSPTASAAEAIVRRFAAH